MVIGYVIKIDYDRNYLMSGYVHVQQLQVIFKAKRNQ